MADKQALQNQKQNFNFLTETFEVLKCFDKNSTKLNNKINELKVKFEKSRAVLASMNGIDMSYMEQTEYYNLLLNEYKLKVDLLNHYKEISTFELAPIPQIGDVDFSLADTNNRLEADILTEPTMVSSSSMENFDRQESITQGIVPKEEIDAQQNGSFDISFD